MIKPLLICALGTLFLLNINSCTERKDKERVEVMRKSLQTKVGEKFSVGNILDSSNRLVNLSFTQSDITIIDFWFDECPPCIEEMMQFESLLNGKENKVTVISISINRHGLWKSILKKPGDRYTFLSSGVKNWKHYNLQSLEDERLKNSVPMDNLQQLKQKLNVTFYPAYFIVDRGGVIISRPVSAVDYIKAL